MNAAGADQEVLGAYDEEAELSRRKAEFLEVESDQEGEKPCVADGDLDDGVTSEASGVGVLANRYSYAHGGEDGDNVGWGGVVGKGMGESGLRGR